MSFSTKVSFISEGVYEDLKDIPDKCKYTVEFDASDATILAYVEEFRKFLRLSGFAETSINDFLGAE